MTKPDLIPLLKEAGEVFKAAARTTKILSTLAWGSEVAEEFFRKKESALPKPRYVVDVPALTETRKALEHLGPKLLGEHPVLLWLQRMRTSFLSGISLLLEIEKPAFFELSTELYGSASSRLFNGQSSNLELAQAIASRLSLTSVNDCGEDTVFKSAEEFRRELEGRLQSHPQPFMPIRAELTSQIVAKVVAGMSRIRIREDAKFSEFELSSLWNHEIESHCLTAHNGAAHEHCDFLMAGGPRSTMTQEGLAVFYEVYGHTMSQRRFVTLCNRVEATHMAESGADFIQVYRWYKSQNESPLEAFYNTQRIFRGAKLTGGGPFTKDVVYLAGLLGVYNFLRIAVKHQNRLLVESLVCGRMALEDVATIAWLRTRGLVGPPRFVPDWLRNWEALLSSFSLAAVLSGVDLSAFQGYFDEYYTLQNWDLSV